ncbi:DUF433 domain-containing protein [Kamptonema sp. UHCC 0994]|uniref:DUF433 domain-containing protein n=1 Tax=Kamptonema sp. UHCC 0994 TaxID=3031329 RepID=UPI0023B888F1|nr:DUF433 domain-containing protein [Kamptonema sp. UHCC 0994]MDF0551790.1 DUF433 domain-containing protein [Kamptonema sp. UHCC 0994]
MAVVPVLNKQYVEQYEGSYRIVGSRISLDSVVYQFLIGTPPEEIVENFPLLTIEQVYGAIAFYLGNREAIDSYLKEGEAEFEEVRQSFRKKNPLLYQKLVESQAKRQSEI